MKTDKNMAAIAIDLEELSRVAQSRLRQAYEGTSKWDYAEEAARLAKALRDKPTLKGLKAFREAELQWHKLSKGRRFLHQEFEKAIRSGNYVVNKHVIKNALRNHDPSIGIVYFAKTTDLKGQLKLGYTAKLPLYRRLQIFRARYHHSDMDVALFARVAWPARVERKVAKMLGIYRVAAHAKGKSIEWYRVDVDVARTALKAAISAVKSSM